MEKLELFTKSKKLSKLYHWKDSGAIYLMLLPLLALFLLLIFSCTSLILKSQNRIALEYRLQICDHSILARRRDFLKKIIHFNQIMQPLQMAVYMSRNSKFLPPVRIVGLVSEQIALRSLKALAQARELLIQSNFVQEEISALCAPSTYSTIPAFCFWKKLAASDFYREPTLYPDVPPLLSLNKNQNILNVSCHSRFHSQPVVEKMYLLSDPKLRQSRFRYGYGKI